MNMKIALIGCGEVGDCYAKAWVAGGHSIVGICELRQDAEMQARAASYGSPLHGEPGSWLAQADIVAVSYTHLTLPTKA